MQRERERFGPAQRFDPAQLLILTSWAYIVLPRLIQTFTASKYRTEISDSIPVSHLSLMSSRALGLALLGLSLATSLAWGFVGGFLLAVALRSRRLTIG